MLNVDTLPQVGQKVATRAVPIKSIVPTFLTSPEDTQGQKSETSWSENIRHLKNLLSQNQYKEAVLFGGKVRREYGAAPDTDSVYSIITSAEFDLHYAKALFYTGATEEAITVLKGVITELECGRDPQDVACQSGSYTLEGRPRNWVLGQAHNHIGYVYWMNQGRYGLALREFRMALSYFYASGLLEEYANTLDNMGRIYAVLYQRNRAERLMDKSLELRLELEPDYRIALSLNSRAITHLVFEEPHRAQRWSIDALSIFERLGAQRGIGLACITLGRSLRHLGTVTFLNQAATHLKRAVDIFEQSVDEPVRLIEAYNELECTYRDRAALARRSDSNSSLAESFDRRAVQYLWTAVKLAEGKNAVLYVDSCEDLAQTYFQGQQFGYAKLWLQRAERAVPGIYRIKAGSGLRNVPVEECVEGFWYQMGKIEMLRGHLAFDCGLSNHNGIGSREVLGQATQHYAFAIAYFKQYSERTIELRTIFQQIHSRFKNCKSDDIRYVQDEVLPTIAETDALDPSDLCEFLEDALSLALE